jgi:hypothetical protein
VVIKAKGLHALNMYIEPVKAVREEWVHMYATVSIDLRKKRQGKLILPFHVRRYFYFLLTFLNAELIDATVLDFLA